MTITWRARRRRTGRGCWSVCGRGGRSRGVRLVCEWVFFMVLWIWGGGGVSWKLWGGLIKERFFDSRLDDINKNCLEAFRKHWECLDQNNQQLWQCRRREMKLNGCVFDKLVSLSLLPSPPPSELRVQQRILIEIYL